MLSCFSLTVIDSHRTTFTSFFGWYALGSCFYMGSNKVFISVIWSMFFRCLMKSIKLVSYSYCILIAYITKVRTSHIMKLSLFLISVETQAKFCLDNSLMGRYNKRGACVRDKTLFIHSLFMNI